MQVDVVFNKFNVDVHVKQLLNALPLQVKQDISHTKVVNICRI